MGVGVESVASPKIGLASQLCPGEQALDSVYLAVYHQVRIFLFSSKVNRRVVVVRLSIHVILCLPGRCCIICISLWKSLSSSWFCYCCSSPTSAHLCGCYSRFLPCLSSTSITEVTPSSPSLPIHLVVCMWAASVIAWCKCLHCSITLNLKRWPVPWVCTSDERFLECGKGTCLLSFAEAEGLVEEAGVIQLGHVLVWERWQTEHGFQDPPSLLLIFVLCCVSHTGIKQES